MTDADSAVIPAHRRRGGRKLAWLRWPQLLVAPLLAIAAVSLVRGVLNAQSGSQDFQWSPTVLLLRGINPYTHQLAGNPGGEIIMTQSPNYAHVLYVLLLPFGALEWTTAKWAWATTNAVLAVAVCVGLCRKFGMNGSWTAVALAVFLCSTPVRVCIGNGQHALLVLALLSLLFFSERPIGKVVGGLGYAKYSFAPPFFLYELFRRGPLVAALSCVAGLLGLVLFMWISSDWRMSVIVQPLIVSRTIAIGNGDVMSFLDVVFGRSAIPAVLYIGVPVVLSGLAALFAVRLKLRDDYAFAFLCCAALTFFTHLTYDYVFLLPALLVSLREIRQVPARVMLAIVAYHWFVLKAMDVVANSTGWVRDDIAMVSVGLAANVAVMIGLVFLDRVERGSFSMSPQRLAGGGADAPGRRRGSI